VKFRFSEKQTSASRIRLLGERHHRQTVRRLGKYQFSEMRALGAALLVISSSVRIVVGADLGQTIAAPSTPMYLTVNRFRSLLDSVHELAFRVVSHLALEMISGVTVIHQCRSHFPDTLVTVLHHIVLSHRQLPHKHHSSQLRLKSLQIHYPNNRNLLFRLLWSLPCQMPYLCQVLYHRQKKQKQRTTPQMVHCRLKNHIVVHVRRRRRLQT